MALAPTDKFLSVHYEDSNNVTQERNFFPHSVETITISDVTSADYTKTVASVGQFEIRPYSLVKIAVTGGHFTVNAVVTISSTYHLVGDMVEFVFTPSDIVSPRTLTIKDDASTPNTLDTLSSTTDASRSTSSRRFVLQANGTWTKVADVPLATGTIAATTGNITTVNATTVNATTVAATTVTSTNLALSSGATVTKFLVGTKTWDPASITAPNTVTTTVTVTGATAGDYVVVTLTTLTSACLLNGYVSGSDTVTVTLGVLAGTVDVASGTLNALVIKAS